MRLDPLSLPVRFEAHDGRADGGVRHVELDRQRVVLRREVRGMRMAVSVRVSDFLGIALRGRGETQQLFLQHRDPSLSIPLYASNDNDEIAAAWQSWCEIFALPQLTDTRREPALRRRRRNVISKRRPRFLVRRRAGGLLNQANRFGGEREIIARN